MANSGNELIVSALFANLAKISDFVSEAAIQAGLAEQAVYAVQMAVDEACTNIIEHAYGGENKGDIRLVCHLRTEGLQVTIYDQGLPFDPTQCPVLDTQAALSARESGGMGVFFISKLMDEVQFTFNTPAGNRLTLFKRRTQTS